MLRRLLLLTAALSLPLSLPSCCHAQTSYCGLGIFRHRSPAAPVAAYAAPSCGCGGQLVSLPGPSCAAPAQVVSYAPQQCVGVSAPVLPTFLLSAPPAAVQYMLPPTVAYAAPAPSCAGPAVYGTAVAVQAAPVQAPAPAPLAAAAAPAAAGRAWILIQAPDGGLTLRPLPAPMQ